MPAASVSNIYNGSADGKQVAIVQPQRRDTTEQNECNTPRNSSQSKRQRSGNHADQSVPDTHEGRKAPHHSPKSSAHGATKACMWIESRKTKPRTAKSTSWSSVCKSPPLREAAMRRAASLTKLHATPFDQTKQVAIMLMTGHTPKSKLSTKQTRRTPSFLVKKSSPVATPKGNNTSGSVDRNTSRKKTSAGECSGRVSASHSVSMLEISDASPSRSTSSVRSARTPQQNSMKSPLLPTPKKSAMKDPKNSSRKTESIKFDLSNLENYSQVSEELTSQSQDKLSEGFLTLRYDTSSVQSSPSSRKSIHSRSSRILEKSLGTSFKKSPGIRCTRNTFTSQSPSSPRKSSRGIVIIQKTLESDNVSSRSSRRSTKTLTDQSLDTTVETAYRTKTLSPRSPRGNLETYSIVDLVSMESNESERSTSMYKSAGSINSSAAAFGTPNNSSGRKTRSTIDLALIDSSTPFVGKVTKKLGRSRSNPDLSDLSSITRNESQPSVRKSVYSRRSKSITTPQDILKYISVNSKGTSRSSGKKSGINDSDLHLISDNSYVEDESQRSSKNILPKPKQKRRSTIKSSPNMQCKLSRQSGDTTPNSIAHTVGMSTPEQRHSPEDVGTPVLSIQSLLDSSQSSLVSQMSNKKRRVSVNVKRKTIGAIHLDAKRRRTGSKSKSFSFTARRGLLRLSKDSSDKEDAQSNDKMVTPKSAVKLVQEAVKNKHSTAKKPQSKRSIIDNLDESDIVKQLFNSPVKRKLSQSMTEFSRKQLFDEDEINTVRRPTRNTAAGAVQTPELGALNHTPVFTPEWFVSPVGSPTISPDLIGVKRLFQNNTPNNNLSDLRGVKSLLRSPRTRKSIRNDLTNVHGVKRVFAKSPKNRLSDVAVKRMFTAEPRDDLRSVSGVKSLFHSQKKNKSPTNDLTDVRGVKKLFQRRSPENDLRRVSGMKRILRNISPRNDLRDVRGVKRMYGEEKRKDDLNDVSGVEELFNESIASIDKDRIFDQLLGKPPIKTVYSKSFMNKTSKASKIRKVKSSYDLITNNVEEWIEQELQKRLHKDSNEKKNRELQNLITDTVEGVPQSRRESRVSRSALSGEPADRLSASSKYSARKLPFFTSGITQLDGQDRILPLKKRVLHSTPLKGKRPTAPTLRRVSPIPTSNPIDTSTRSDQQSKEDMETKSSLATRKKLIDNDRPESKPTGKTRNNKTKEAVPTQEVVDAEDKENANKTSRSSKPRASLVVTKESVMNARPIRSTRANPEPLQQILTKNARRQKQTENDNNQAASISHSKENVSVNTRRKNRGKDDDVLPAPKSKEPVQNKRTRNTKGKTLGGENINSASEVQDPMNVEHPKINVSRRKTAIKVNDPPIPTPVGCSHTEVQTSPSKRKLKKITFRKSIVKNTPKRLSLAKVQLQPGVRTRSLRKLLASQIAAKAEANVTETKKRKVEESPARSTNIPVKVIKEGDKKGRKPKNVVETEDNTQTPDEEPKGTRSRPLKTQESTQSEPPTTSAPQSDEEPKRTRGRPRKKRESILLDPPVTRRKKLLLDLNNTKLLDSGRKRKTTAASDVPNKIAKNNAGNTGEAEDTSQTNTRAARRAKAVVKVEANNKGKKSPVDTRDKTLSAAATSSTTTTTTRKKKTPVETTPAKATTSNTGRSRRRK